MKKTLLFLAAALTFSMAAKAQTVFSENFDEVSTPGGVGVIPDSWTLYEDSLVNYTGSPYGYMNNSWCVINFSGATPAAVSCSYTVPEGTDCDRWLITPSITIPSTGYSLFFDTYGYNPNYPEKLYVKVSTTGTNKSDFTTTLADIVIDGTNYPAGWNSILLNLDQFAGQSIHIAFVNHGDGLYNIVDNIAVKVVPANGISAAGATAPAWTSQGGLCNVALTVLNEGSSNLTSFDVTFNVNNGTEQTLNVTGINVAPFSYYTYTFPAQVLDLGVATINMTVSNPNNSTDVDPSDNSASCQTTVYDPNTMTQRNTVLEHFTTARCPNCPSGHERLEAAIQGREDRVIWIAHHVGYYTDAMTITESEQMMDFFNDGGSTYAPASMLDRDRSNATAEDPGPVFFPDNTVGDVITNALSAPAFVNVNLSDVNYDVSNRQLSVTVSGNFVADMTFDSPRLSLYIMEDNIMGTQSGASGQYQHNHVIRGCITDVWGDATAITNTTAGSTFSKTYTYTLPSTWKASDCWLAAFVSNYTTDVNSRQIANGTKSGYLTNVAIDDVENPTVSVKTYPNPTTEMAFVETEGVIRSYEMVDAMGRKVMGQENLNADVLELNVSNLTSGIYFITVVTDHGTATQRLNVVK